MRNAVRILKTTGIPARHSLAQSDGLRAESWPARRLPASRPGQAREGSSSCFSRCQQPRPGRAREGQPAISAILPPRLYWAAPLTGWLAGWLAGLHSKEQGSQRESQKLVVNVSCQQL